MKKLIPIILLAFVSCKKEEPKPNVTTPQCDCYKVYQTFDPNYGWMNDYNGDTTKMDCSLNNGQYTWVNAQHTQRYYIQCN